MSKRLLLLTVLFIVSLIISPIHSSNDLPEIYVEMLTSNNRAKCSGFLVDSKTVITSLHCKNLKGAKFIDGSIQNITLVYSSIEDDIAIYSIYNDYHLAEYLTFGYAFLIGFARIHSNVNHLKVPIFSLFYDRNIIIEMDDIPGIFTVMDVHYPLINNIKPGHSGAPVIQNQKIVGMVLGHSKNNEYIYVIQGMDIFKHFENYKSKEKQYATSKIP